MLGQNTQVDCVIKERGEETYRVMLEVHKGEWLRQNAMWLLEEKLNAYAAFVLDGQMQSLYAGSNRENTVVVVASEDPIPEKVKPVLDAAVIVFERHGIRLEWNPDGGMHPKGTQPPEGFTE